ncbi:hypothetical protein BSKO_12534 [Bryopsis sp. KO-2023]|nr:hypothetical protein BSKO_12534 [Bryopsis sp. KO-2023]
MFPGPNPMEPGPQHATAGPGSRPPKTHLPPSRHVKPSTRGPPQQVAGKEFAATWGPKGSEEEEEGVEGKAGACRSGGAGPLGPGAACLTSASSAVIVVPRLATICKQRSRLRGAVGAFIVDEDRSVLVLFYSFASGDFLRSSVNLRAQNAKRRHWYEQHKSNQDFLT